MLTAMNVKTRYDGAYTYRADDELQRKIQRADHFASRYLADAIEATRPTDMEVRDAE